MFMARLPGEVIIRREREEKALVINVWHNFRSPIQEHPRADFLRSRLWPGRKKSIRLHLKPKTENEPSQSKQPQSALGSSKSFGLMGAAPKLKVVLIIHVNRIPKDSKLQSLVGWIRGLDPPPLDWSLPECTCHGQQR